MYSLIEGVSTFPGSASGVSQEALVQTLSIATSHPAILSVREHSKALSKQDISHRAANFLNYVYDQKYLQPVVPSLDTKSLQSLLGVLNPLLAVIPVEVTSDGEAIDYEVFDGLNDDGASDWAISFKLKKGKRFPSPIYAAINMHCINLGYPSFYWLFNTATPFNEKFLNERFAPHPTEPEMYYTNTVEPLQ